MPMRGIIIFSLIQGVKNAKRIKRDAEAKAEELINQANEEKNKAEQARLEEIKKKIGGHKVDPLAEKKAAELKEKISANLPEAISRVVQAVLP